CNNHEASEAILGAAKDKGILKEVLTTANITWKFQDDDKHTNTPLGLVALGPYTWKAKTILDAACNAGILKEVFTSIKNMSVKELKVF
ncbi:MAG: hypothetical protein LBC34_00810, partial [Rickettsiales bacterium]|nr:hypothetical protein [Rickettsiales bacterium]